MTLQNRYSGNNRKRWLSASLAVCILALVLPVVVSSHEPITTNVRFNKEIIRILEQKCLACHSAGGIKADISLSTFEEARPWAKAIKEEVLEKRMPPYQTVKGFGLFHSDYGLSQRETDLIVSWVEGGAPKGDEKDLPTRASSDQKEWRLGKPDLILKAIQPASTGNKPSGPSCQVVPTGLTSDRWISGLEFQPGNPAVVERAEFRIIANGGGSTGSTCTSKSRGDLLGSWVPGEMPFRYPSDVARMLPEGARIEIDVEYANADGAARGESKLALYFTGSERPRQLNIVALRGNNIEVPANNSRLRVSSQFQIATDAEVIGVRPHLFPYAQTVEVRAVRPDGSYQVLIWSRDRKLDWEPTFQLRKGVPVAKGGRIEVIAYLDNSTSNSRLEEPPRAFSFNSTLCDVMLASTAPNKLTSK